jgi:hypothetical protein
MRGSFPRSRASPQAGITYYALTEVCKDRDPSFKPARLAVEGVREGKYRAARGRPG